ncbi:unnamed protein product, partial [Phaeothamnion confervicola]
SSFPRHPTSLRFHLRDHRVCCADRSALSSAAGNRPAGPAPAAALLPWSCFELLHVNGPIQDNEGRLHKTDGVIFQPNAPYQPGSDRRLLKWKWKDLASVDLKVGRRGGGSGELKFETAGPNDLPIDMSDPRQGQPIVNMAPQDLMRLQADIKARPSCTIAEVALHEATGLWRYLGLRPDKTKPNFLTTVMGTLLEMAEGMSPQELQYRMMCRTPADDDWAKQINKMGASAIKYRREKLAIEQANARR